MYTICPSQHWERDMTAGMNAAAVAMAVMAAICLGGPLHAQSSDWQTWLAARDASFSGVALVGHGDTIAAVAAYGLADRATGRANTTDTRFNLGSINKT